MKRSLTTVIGAAVITLAVPGCETIAPALSSLILAIGQDLLAATAVNYTPRYAMEVENLLTILARQATGLQFQGQLAGVGYQPPPPSYAEPQGRYHQPDPYATQQPVYGQEPYQDPYATQQPGYGHDGTPQPGYGQATYQDPYAVPSQQTGYQDPYAVPSQQTGYQDPYAIPAGAYRTRSVGDPAPVSLGVALLARRAGSNRLEAVDDGDTLQDGRGDPGHGDLLRVHFQANCACWVYVIGIDATGYVARIFPDPDSALTNPVSAGVNYLMPGGSEWWALDDHRGVEQIYFVAAREPRPEIEAAVARLAAQPRSVAESYQAVTEPAIVPGTRGLVKVQAPAPVNVPISGSPPAVVTPTIFTNTAQSTDVVITRWFHHR